MDARGRFANRSANDGAVIVPAGERAPAFEPGNDAAEKHGARSARRVEPLATELVSELLAVAPWCAQGAFAGTVAAWSWAEAQAALLRAYIDEHGMLDDEGKPLPALALLDRVETRAGRLRDALGLTPRAWAALVASLGAADHNAAARGLESLRAVGRELARTAALPEGADDE
jgi:hypothetical protein